MKMYDMKGGSKRVMPAEMERMRQRAVQAELLATAKAVAAENADLKATLQRAQVALAEKDALLADAVAYYQEVEAIFADYQRAHDIAKAEVVQAHVKVAEKDVQIAKLQAQLASGAQ